MTNPLALRLLLTSAAKHLPEAPNVQTALELGFPKQVQTNWYSSNWARTSTPRHRPKVAARLASDFKHWKETLDLLGLKPIN